MQLSPILVKIGVLEELAEVWNQAGLTYSVTNGLQGYPETIGRDLDICFLDSDLIRARDLTISSLKSQGFTPIVHHLAWVYWIVGIRRRGEEIDSVQIDLFDHLQWAFCWLIDGVSEVNRPSKEGPFQVDAWSPVAKRLVLNALAQNYSTFEKKPHYLDTTEVERSVLADQFERISGSKFEGLQKAIAERDLSQIKHEIPAFRKAVLKKSLRDPSKLLRRFHSAWLKQWCVNLNPVPTTPIISINGSDQERLRLLTKDLDMFLQEHLVFTCDPVRDLSDELASQGKVRAWLQVLKGHFRKDRKRSALQVIQIYLNHPAGNPVTKISEKLFGGGRFLPRPMLLIDLDEETDLTLSEFQKFFLSRLLDWFDLKQGS